MKDWLMMKNFERIFNDVYILSEFPFKRHSIAKDLSNVQGKLGEWDTRNFTAGNYVLRINAKDKAGNETIIDKTLNLQPDFSVSAEGIKITNMDGLEIPPDKLSIGIKLLVNADIANSGFVQCLHENITNNEENMWYNNF